MIRTRDVYVLASCLFVLGFAILATIFLRYGSLSEKDVPLLTDTSSSEVIYTAERIDRGKNRNSTIERLRSLIARGDTTVVPSPSVEEEVIIPTATTSAEDGLVTSELVTCGGDDSRAVIASWPASVEVSTATGNRIVSVLVSNPTYTPSTTTVSTEEEFISKTLMTTRAFPVKGQTPQCVPGAVVGITASGGLIQNDASYFKEYGSDFTYRICA
jgi:hypothetical protein